MQVLANNLTEVQCHFEQRTVTGTTATRLVCFRSEEWICVERLHWEQAWGACEQQLLRLA